jgi:hypothetical protein
MTNKIEKFVINILVIRIGPEFIIIRENISAGQIRMEKFNLVQLTAFFTRPFFYQTDPITKKLLDSLGVVVGFDNITTRMSTKVVDFVLHHIISMCGGDLQGLLAVSKKYLPSGLRKSAIDVIVVKLKNRFISLLIDSNFFEDRFVFCNVPRVRMSPFRNRSYEPRSLVDKGFEPQLFALSKKLEEIVTQQNFVERKKLQADFLLLLKNPLSF